MNASTNLPAAPLPSLSEREARFCEHMAVFDSPVDAWLASGEVAPTTKRTSMQRAAYYMLGRPHVRQRITELRNRMAEAGPQASRAALVADLQEAVSVDVREIVSLSVHHCRDCYSSAAYVHHWTMQYGPTIAAGRASLPSPLKPDEFDPDRDPWAACSACRGAGVNVTHFTPFDKLSAPAKRLLRGVECHADGSIKKVLLADQSALRLELHRTVPNFYAPTTSVNLNVNATVKPLKRGMTIEEALQVMETLAPTTEPTDDHSIVSQQ